MFSKLTTASTCLLALAGMTVGMAVGNNQQLKPRGDCNANNCLRAYDHSMTDALPFCSTFIQSTVTQVVTPTATISGASTITAMSTVYPTIAPATIPAHLSSRCVDSDADATPLPIRMSSACSCISAPAATVTTTIAAPTVTVTVQAIDAFVYGPTVQTLTAQQNLISADGQTITVDTNSLVPPFANPGSNPPYRSLSMLYQYGNDMRIWAATEYSGTYTFVPGGRRMSAPGEQELFSYERPQDASITILAVVWGPAVINDASVYQALYNDAAASQQFCFENTFFNIDTWYGYVKTGAIYYLDANGAVQVVVGVEHTCATFA